MLINEMDKKLARLESLLNIENKGTKDFMLQVNAIIRMMRIFSPLYWLFQYCWRREHKRYMKKLIDERKKIMESLKEEKRQKEEEVIDKKEKVGRNKLCLCGSGKKYKKCCLKKNEIVPDLRA